MKNHLTKILLLPALALLLASVPTAAQAATTLTWRDHTANEQGFYIERATSSNGTYTRIGTVGANVTSFVDSTGSSGATYYYRVKAYNGTWNSLYTNTVSKVYAAGSLSVSGTSWSGNVSLSGNDWAHWGLSGVSSFNHKNGANLISNYTKVGSGSVSTYSNSPTGFTWTGGTPTASASNTKTGLAIAGTGNGFSFTVPADTTSRTVKVYVGGSGSTGKLTAHLSDGSAVDATSSTGTSGSYSTIYTITYKAAAASQNLRITWQLTGGSGTVILQAASL